MRMATLVCGLALLAACGGKDDPLRPNVRTNVSIGPNGVSTSTGVSVRKGPVAVGVHL